MRSRTDRQLREEIHRLRRENLRFREVIELLSSQTNLLRKRTEPADRKAAELTAFESFIEDDAQRPFAPNGALGPARGFSFPAAAPWFPAFEEGLSHLNPAPGWRSLTLHDTPIRIGFKLFGMNSEEVERVVSQVESRQLRDRDFIPVFVTDQEEFEPFRARGYVFEYIPSSVTNSPPSRRSERRYLRKRLELITSKWGLRELVDLAK
jgi:hypothetical protein